MKKWLVFVCLLSCGCQAGGPKLTLPYVQTLRCSARLTGRTMGVQNRSELKPALQQGRLTLKDLERGGLTTHQCVAGRAPIPLKAEITPDGKSFSLSCTNPDHGAAGFENGFPRFIYGEGVFFNSERKREFPPEFPLKNVPISTIQSVGADEDGSIIVVCAFTAESDVTNYFSKEFPSSPFGTAFNADPSWSAEKFRGTDRIIVQLSRRDHNLTIRYWPSALRD